VIHLHTSFLVDLLREGRRRQAGRATRRLSELAEEQLGVSLHARCELRAGAELSRDPAVEHRNVDLVCSRLEVVVPDERFPSIYGEVLADLRRRRQTLSTMDLLIACTALAGRAALLTANERHFGGVRELRVLAY
jgi:predicted nucleic acid-binding protein